MAYDQFAKRFWSGHQRSHPAIYRRPVTWRRCTSRESQHQSVPFTRERVVGSIPTAPTIDINVLAFVSYDCAHVSPKKRPWLKYRYALCAISEQGPTRFARSAPSKKRFIALKSQ